MSSLTAAVASAQYPLENYYEATIRAFSIAIQHAWSALPDLLHYPHSTMRVLETMLYFGARDGETDAPIEKLMEKARCSESTVRRALAIWKKEEIIFPRCRGLAGQQGGRSTTVYVFNKAHKLWQTFAQFASKAVKKPVQSSPSSRQTDSLNIRPSIFLKQRTTTVTSQINSYHRQNADLRDTGREKDDGDAKAPEKLPERKPQRRTVSLESLQILSEALTERWRWTLPMHSLRYALQELPAELNETDLLEEISTNNRFYERNPGTIGGPGLLIHIARRLADMFKTRW